MVASLSRKFANFAALGFLGVGGELSTTAHGVSVRESSGAQHSMPTRFNLEFDEFFYNETSGKPMTQTMRGQWHYDWARRYWRYRHGDTWMSMFCGINSSPQIKQGCTQHFLPDADNKSQLYIKYDNGTCCHLCGADEGCSILIPDWLTHDNYSPIELEERGVANPVDDSDAPRRSCKGWARPGATAVDGWYTEIATGLPCMYYELFSIPAGMSHNMTFVHSSYNEDQLPESFFQVSDQCKRTKCPGKFLSSVPWPQTTEEEEVYV